MSKYEYENREIYDNYDFDDDSVVYFNQSSYDQIISGTQYEDYLNNLDVILQNLQMNLINNQPIDITQLNIINQSFEQVEDYYEYNFGLDIEDYYEATYGFEPDDILEDYYKYNYGVDVENDYDSLYEDYNISNLSSDINNTYQLNSVSSRTEVEDFVERFYTNVLGRVSDESGLKNWSDNLINSTLTVDNIATGFFNSQEFLSSNTSNNEYVDILYRTFLDREADIEGKKHWVNSLENETSRDDILDGFIYSEEFNLLTKSYNIEIA